MTGKELLRHFVQLPQQQQNRILVDAYGQIVRLHDKGESFDSFTWQDCSLDNDVLTISAHVDDYFNDEAFERNLLDYAKVIYCLATGNKSSESMTWDAGRKIQSPVLREIVLTICGRNYSVEPLLDKLRHSYIDENTFFENYTTVDEKEGRDASEKRRRIDQQNRVQEEEYRNTVNLPRTNRKSMGEKIAVFIVLALCFGGYKAYKHSKDQQKFQTMQQYELQRQQRRQMHEELRKYNYELDLKNNRINITRKDSVNDTYR